MRRFGICVFVLAVIFFNVEPSDAQLSTDGPVVYGHHHFYVSSIELHKKFWVDTLGGVDAGNLGPAPVAVIRFPNVQVLLSERVPTGGTRGTSVNHVGFKVPDLRSIVSTAKDAGYPIVSREDLPPAVSVDEDGLGHIANQNTYVAFVMAPDGIKVELFEDKMMNGSIALHHVHFASPDVAEMQAWYEKAFGAVPGMRGSFQAADLPGVNLTFSPSATPVKPTRFKALDHIGFEIKNLEEFCKELEAKGIELDGEYRFAEALNLGVAFVTDPWGTRIELTEGLGAY